MATLYTGRNEFLTNLRGTIYHETFENIPPAYEDQPFPSPVYFPSLTSGNYPFNITLNFDNDGYVYFPITNTNFVAAFDAEKNLTILVSGANLRGFGLNTFIVDFGNSVVSDYSYRVIFNQDSYTGIATTTGNFLGYLTEPSEYITGVRIIAPPAANRYLALDNLIFGSDWFSSGIIGKSYIQKTVLRPYSDISGQNWNTAPYYSKLNEISPNTGENVYSDPYPTYGNAFEVALTPTSTPQNIGFYKVRYQIYKNNNVNELNLKVGLYDGSNLIRLEEHTNIPSIPIITGFTLTSGEVSNITGFTNLRLRFESSYGSVSETYYLIDENGNFLVDENGYYLNSP